MTEKQEKGMLGAWVESHAIYSLFCQGISDSRHLALHLKLSRIRFRNAVKAG